MRGQGLALDSSDKGHFPHSRKFLWTTLTLKAGDLGQEWSSVARNGDSGLEACVA